MNPNVFYQIEYPHDTKPLLIVIHELHTALQECITGTFFVTPIQHNTFANLHQRTYTLLNQEYLTRWNFLQIWDMSNLIKYSNYPIHQFNSNSINISDIDFICSFWLLSFWFAAKFPLFYSLLQSFFMWYFFLQ